MFGTDRRARASSVAVVRGSPERSLTGCGIRRRARGCTGARQTSHPQAGHRHLLHPSAQSPRAGDPGLGDVVVRLYKRGPAPRRYLDDACRPEGAHGLRAVGPPLDAAVDGSNLRSNPYGATDREPPIPVGCLLIECSKSARWKQGSTGPGAAWRGGDWSPRRDGRRVRAFAIVVKMNQMIRLSSCFRLSRAVSRAAACHAIVRKRRRASTGWNASLARSAPPAALPRAGASALGGYRATVGRTRVTAPNPSDNLKNS
jgi:hypothetical protein